MRINLEYFVIGGRREPLKSVGIEPPRSAGMTGVVTALGDAARDALAGMDAYLPSLNGVKASATICSMDNETTEITVTVYKELKNG